MDVIDQVSAIIDTIPTGSVMTYGEIAKVAGIGPRQAGRAVGLAAPHVPWWRVVYADGTPATCHDGTAPRLLAAEGVPFRDGRVDMRTMRNDAKNGHESEDRSAASASPGG